MRWLSWLRGTALRISIEVLDSLLDALTPRELNFFLCLNNILHHPPHMYHVSTRTHSSSARWLVRNYKIATPWITLFAADPR